MTGPAAYRHVQVYTTLWLVLPMAAVVTLGVALVSGPLDLSNVALLSLPLLLGALLLLGRLLIELDGQHLRWQFGYVGWLRWQLALADIRQVERSKAPAMAGSGIKGSRRKRLYNVTIGGPALLLTLHDGRTVMLGTPEPERLAAFIEARLPRPQ
ncbi:MAG: hypothetical protein Q7U99_13810 [Rubrivivax sp.]|nr:hypothetical protein [Rubrivivax sp.]MDP3225254.1 hypothetical protein [Rubrivivax sp.]